MIKKIIPCFSIVALLLASALSQAHGQTLRKVCAEVLHEGAYTTSAEARADVLKRFRAGGCWDDITKAFGVPGVPPKGDVSPLALAAVAYMSLYVASKNEPTNSGGVLSGSHFGGVWSGHVMGEGEIPNRKNPYGGGVTTMPGLRGPTGGGIDAVPLRNH